MTIGNYKGILKRGNIMGAHKNNPNHLLMKEGKLPPREAKLSKRETERLIYGAIESVIGERIGRFHNVLPSYSNCRKRRPKI